MDNIIVIVGPTGSGKTKLAIQIATKFNGEIINADAFQVYKEISIGTSKANSGETKLAKFHFNGELSIYDEWDIKIFQDKANQVIKHILNEKKIPIIVGGSNLYIDALIYNYDLSAPPRNNKFDDYSCEQLCEYIEKNDKTVLEKFDCKNKRRLIRAAQIIDSGNQLHVKNKPLYNPIIIETSLPSKEELYDTINKNVDKMFNSGWKQEVIDLYKKDNDIGKLNAFKAIGYPEILNSIINNTNVDIDKIKQKTRQYAKRQLTWIKYHYSAHPIYNQKNLNEIFDYITSKL